MSDILDRLTRRLYKELSGQPAKLQIELAQALEVLAHAQKFERRALFFPDEGKYRRELYPKHVELFNAGAEYIERAFVAGNRVGKSEAGAYEVACHLEGDYPKWWKGYRVNRPVVVWVGGDTGTTVRDILQKKLLGDDLEQVGTGMLRREAIVLDSMKMRRGVPDAVEKVSIKSKFGGESKLFFKTYDQGRKAWQGTEVDFVWLDEEPPEEIYGEAMIRLMTTKGRMLVTFTPLMGLTELMMRFMENDQNSSANDKKYVVTVGWDDVPHLSEDMKKTMLETTPPRLRKARSQGIPSVGEGLVWPVEQETFVVEPFEIPKHYMRLGSLDVGWRATASLVGARDPNTGVIYVYREYKKGQMAPDEHALVLRHFDVPFEIDPASRAASQADGEKLFDLYSGLGLKLRLAENAVGVGLQVVYEALLSGQLKVFSTCKELLREMALYRIDKNGKVVKKNDHLCDCLRYLAMAPSSSWSWRAQRVRREKVVNISDVYEAYF